MSNRDWEIVATYIVGDRIVQRLGWQPSFPDEPTARAALRAMPCPVTALRAADGATYEAWPDGLELSIDAEPCAPEMH